MNSSVAGFFGSQHQKIFAFLVLIKYFKEKSILVETNGKR